MQHLVLLWFLLPPLLQSSSWLSLWPSPPPNTVTPTTFPDFWKFCCIEEKFLTLKVSPLLQLRRRSLLSSHPIDSAATGGTSAGTSRTLISGTGISFSQTLATIRGWVSQLCVNMKTQTSPQCSIQNKTPEGSSPRSSVEKVFLLVSYS